MEKNTFVFKFKIKTYKISWLKFTKIHFFLLILCFNFLFVFKSTVIATTKINSNIQTDGSLSVGTTSNGAKLNIFSQLEDLRLIYDNSNYVSFLASSSSGLAINLSNNYGKWVMVGNATSPSFVHGNKDNALLGTNIEGSAILSGGESLGEYAGPNIINNSQYSVIGGGYGHKIDWLGTGDPGRGNFIGGNGGNGGNIIEKSPQYSSIVGGDKNKITSTTNIAPYADFIGGGNTHTIDSNGVGHNVIMGGQSSNYVYGNGYASVGGGSRGTAWDYSFSGANSQAGSSGKAYAVAGGGYSCPATGAYSMNISGGYCYSLASGQYSFASGIHAKATHDGSFVWTDSNNYDFSSEAINNAKFRATGGMRFVTAIDGSANTTKALTLSTAGNAVITGGVKLATTDTKPICDSSTRGYLWFTQGTSTVKDSFETCAKDATNTYAWRTIY